MSSKSKWYLFARNSEVASQTKTGLLAWLPFRQEHYDYARVALFTLFASFFLLDCLHLTSPSVNSACLLPRMPSQSSSSCPLASPPRGTLDHSRAERIPAALERQAAVMALRLRKGLSCPMTACNKTARHR
jgi:hypothetical protein